MTDKTWEKITKYTIWGLIAFCLTLILAGLFSCTSEKKLLREKSKTDSSTISNLQTENRSLKQENTRLESELKQAQYAGVVFDTTPCPPVNPLAIIVDEHCNVDSVKAALESYYSGLFQSKVKVYADGRIEAQGRLKSANYTLLMQQRIIAERDTRIDSFATALATEKKKEKTATGNVDKYKKRAYPWWLLFVGIVIGCILWQRFGYQITLFIKHIFTKWKA